MNLVICKHLVRANPSSKFGFCDSKSLQCVKQTFDFRRFYQIYVTSEAIMEQNKLTMIFNCL